MGGHLGGGAEPTLRPDCEQAGPQGRSKRGSLPSAPRRVLPRTVVLGEVLVSYKLPGNFFSFMTFFLDCLFYLFQKSVTIIIIIISNSF